MSDSQPVSRSGLGRGGKASARWESSVAWGCFRAPPVSHRTSIAFLSLFPHGGSRLVLGLFLFPRFANPLPARGFPSLQLVISGLQGEMVLNMRVTNTRVARV